MSQHTKEAQHVKKHAIDKILKQMHEYIEDEKAGIKISSSNKPKMYLRMARLLAGTDDSVFIDTVDDLLSKNATGDEIKNKLRGISERIIPNERKRILSDRLHHGIPLELMDVLMKQDPDVMLEFLQAAEDDNQFFGDSRPNVDNSLIEQAHTGAKDKATQKFDNYPYILDSKGDKRFSAHSEGTNKGYDKTLNRIYESGGDMYEAFKPAIEEAKYELKLGINADKSRRDIANKLLIKRGLLKKGEDYWDASMPSERIQKIRKVFAEPEFGMEVAAAYNPYKFQDQEDLDKHKITKQDSLDWSNNSFENLKKVARLTIGDDKLKLMFALTRDGLRSANAAVPDLTDVAETVSERTGGQIARGEYLKAAKDVVTNVGGNILSNLPATGAIATTMAAGAKVAPALTATASGALGLVMTPLAVATTMNAGKNLYSGYLKEKTGTGLGGHVRKFQDKKDGIKEAAKALNSPSPDGPQEITQGETNPVKRFVNEKLVSRGKLFDERFNPLEGEFGISELFLNR